jgi:hypothetical protein
LCAAPTGPWCHAELRRHVGNPIALVLGDDTTLTGIGLENAPFHGHRSTTQRGSRANAAGYPKEHGCANGHCCA